ncbi:flippase [bacterium]|nr:flippase [bacterium]
MKLKMKIKEIFLRNLDQKQTIAKNIFWLSLAQILSKILKAGLVIYAARILGASEYGRFALSLSVVSALAVFGDLGISSLLARQLPKRIKFQSQFLSTSFYLKLLFTFLFIFLVIFSQIFNPSSKIKTLVFLLLVMGVLDSLLLFFYGISRGEQRMEKEALIFLLETLVTVSSGFFFLFTFPSAKNLALAYLIGSFSAFLSAIYLFKNYLKKILFYFEKKFVKEILFSALPFAFAGIVGNLLTYTDVVMIGAILKNSYLIGIYSAPLKIIRLLFIPAGLIAASILPVLSKENKKNQNLNLNLVRKSISLLFLLGFPLFFGGIILAKQIIVFLFGVQYLESTKIFSLLVFLPLLVYPTTIFGYLLFAYNLQMKNAIFSLITAILNIFLNLILISKFSIYGAATATLISQFFNFVLSFFATKNLEKSSPITFSQIKNPLLASILMTFFLLVLKKLSFSLIPTIILGATIYLFSLFLLKESLLKEIKEILFANKLIFK